MTEAQLLSDKLAKHIEQKEENKQPQNVVF